MSNLKNNQKIDEDKTYYNVSLKYEENSSGLTLARFQEERTQPILYNPSEYYLTIDRFSIPAREIPIFIMDIIDNQANPNLTPYLVTFRYLGVDYQANVIYVPENNVTAPASAIPTQVNSPYYYVYSYQHMIKMFNTAIATAWGLVKAAVPAAPTTVTPYLLFDSETKLVSLVTEFVYADPSAFEIYLNEKLLVLLEGFYGKRWGKNLASGRDFSFLIDSDDLNAYALPGVAIPAPPATPVYLRNFQEYITITAISSFATLQFTTASLPISFEYTQTRNNVGSSDFKPILTDFELDINNPGDQRGVLNFFPQGPYRLLNMLGNVPLTKIDFQVWWVDKELNTFPLYLTYNSLLTVKMFFTKKSTFTS